jgi:predicted amidohydrolase
MFKINSAIIVPWGKILEQADGEPVLALKIAASFGYQLACQDLDEVALPTTKETAL